METQTKNDQNFDEEEGGEEIQLDEMSSFDEEGAEDIFLPEDEGGFKEEEGVEYDEEESVGVPVNDNGGERNDVTVSERAGEESVDEKGDGLSREDIVLINKLLRGIKENNDKLLAFFEDLVSSEVRTPVLPKEETDKDDNEPDNDPEGDVREGIFTGKEMIGDDGKQYSVPLNYASKSKLVEGDRLKLTITGKGNFIYKQIDLVSRDRLVGVIRKDEKGNFLAQVDDKYWKVLFPSVTYFNGGEGDEVVILVPQGGRSKWAAVENIIKK